MLSKDNERLVFFSDAIMAVTITLLALDIRLPDEKVNLDGEELLAAIWEMAPHLFAYALSFFVIGLFWLSHRRRFDTITGTHASIVWLNFLFLLLLGLLPFATDVLAENGGLVATVLYAALVAAISLMLVVISLAAEWRGLLAPDAEHPLKERTLGPSLATSAVFAVSIPIAFIDVDSAQLFWLTAFPLNVYLMRRRQRTHTAQN